MAAFRRWLRRWMLPIYVVAAVLLIYYIIARPASSPLAAASSSSSSYSDPTTPAPQTKAKTIMGVTKQVLQAPAPGAAKPKAGDQISVHCTGYVLEGMKKFVGEREQSNRLAHRSTVSAHNNSRDRLYDATAHTYKWSTRDPGQQIFLSF
jgi:hypothetical protein